MARETIPEVYFNRRMAILVGLGFSSGLPFMLTAGTLQAWAQDAHWELATITLFSLTGLPYALKFLWAPLMDRYVPPLLGRRRGWLLVTQVLLAGAIFMTAAIGPPARGEKNAAVPAAHPITVTPAGNEVYWLAVAAMVVAFLSASQDIVADAYRTDVLPAAERGAGAAVFTMGYRIGLIAGAAGALELSVVMGWRSVYALLAGAMIVGVASTLLAPEPPADATAPPRSLHDAVVMPLAQMLRRPGVWAVFLFIVLFKLPEVLVKTMPLLMMKSLGFTNSELGVTQQGLGIAMTIVGALVGGGLVARLGLWRSLWVFGVFGAASNAGYLALALAGKNYPVMVAAVVTENFCAGLVTAGFVAFLMSQCDARYSATQYALLTSLMALAGSLAGAPTGWVVEHWGYAWFFGVTIAAGVPGMLLLLWFRPAEVEREPTSPLAASGKP